MATSTINTEKQENRINVTATNIKDVKVFVNQRLLIYKENRQKGFNLQESFIDNFESFTKDILDNLGKDRLKKIRDYLRENGVYIRKEARKSIADGLLEAIHEPTPSEWPTNDKQPTDDQQTTNNFILNISPSTDFTSVRLLPSTDPTNNPTSNPAIQLSNT